MCHPEPANLCEHDVKLKDMNTIGSMIPSQIVTQEFIRSKSYSVHLLGSVW